MNQGSASLRSLCTERWRDRGLLDSKHWPAFERRLDAEFDHLAGLLWRLYGDRADFALQVEALIASLFRDFEARPEGLKERDRARPPESGWFLESKHVGAVAYVDAFAGSFRGLERRIPYLKELGVTYLHLMPFFDSPERENDGGYAVSSYRHTDPKLGTMADLEHLAKVLEAEGIVLVADFVFNHTSDEHAWAKAALAGEQEFQDYYWLFEREEDVRPWQQNLRDIFPEIRKGSFTWRPELRRWVWTTFNSYQWDLNYANPAVFRAMAGEMVGLANRGIGILRLDAVAFVWKKPGTNCENLPEAHTMIRAFQAAARLVCPSLLFKSEAIVHPNDIVKYIDPRECQLSYNPLLMAELWEAAATKEVRLLALSLRTRHHLPAGTSWTNYLRCHDDIGWTFADEDAGALGINGYDHRQFLNHFYTGEFPGTFSRGVSFQYNPSTGDRRICGSAASLAGIEAARESGSTADLETAIKRLILLYTVVYTAGGIPLLYLGDELAVENRYEYADDPAQAADSRWIHRPRWSDELAERRVDAASPAGRIFRALSLLAKLRREHAVFAAAPTVLDTGHPSVLAFTKEAPGHRLTLIGNFSDHPAALTAPTMDVLTANRWGTELMTGQPLGKGERVLAPCEVLLHLT